MNYRLFSVFCLYLGAIAFASCDLFAPKPVVSINKEYRRPKLQKQIGTVVKITADRSSGSGVIVQKNGKTYTVVTNRHVANRGNRYQIQTADDLVHTGKLLAIAQTEDLALLGFTSDRLYPIAPINTSSLRLHQPLIAMGFPFNSDRLKITSGKLSLKTIKPLKQGYQLGYTNQIHKGMSGGALFNAVGEVVAVNGRSADPIIPDYQYQDSSYPNLRLQQRMSYLSWGIPIVRITELLPKLLPSDRSNRISP